ncbi:MAG TPA: phosphate--acyl-ACP acyltransferase, partial [bacterium]|nr:phosphate--acyl-ACP acyltransferase [bacterium]
MRVVLDAHGTDAHPTPEVRGALEALEQAPGELALVGDAPRLEAAVRKLRGGKIPAGLSFVHAPGAIAMKDAPSRALRRKKDTSMVRAFDLVAEGQADAVVTAGSSGA